MNRLNHAKTLRMTQLAILIAFMLIFAFTPLGFLKVGPIEITFMVLPVAVGAIALGPGAGAILGTVFGIASFVQCFGMSPFGVFLLSLNPILTFIICLIPRILCGWLSGLIFQALKKIDRTRIVSYFVASLSTALLNTLLFILSIVAFFWKNPAFIQEMNGWGIATDNVWVFFVAFVGLNGLVEAIANFIIGGGVSKIIVKFVQKEQ